MPLSISSSKRDRRSSYTRPIAVVLMFLVGSGMALEGVARLGFRRVSRIASRINTEYRSARAVRHGTASRPTILMVGNSLLLEGVDCDALRSRAPAEITRFAFERTNYIDWYYGFRRLFEEGARPDEVLLFLSIPQLLDDSIVGEYGAHYLFRPADVPQIARVAGYDLTKASGLLLADFSLYYAARNEIRNYLLNHAYHSYLLTIRDAATVPAPPLTDEAIVRVASARLHDLQSLCARYGARFRFVMPPGFGTGDRALLEAGVRSHTAVVMPVPLGGFRRDRFRDGFHLNPEGAAQFTEVLASALQEHSSLVSEAR